MSSLLTVNLSEIKENPVALRALDRENEQYLNLVQDVKRRGVITPITVREQSEDGEVYYEICDGLHRFSAAVDAGISTIDVSVKDLSDAEVEETQLVANLVRVDTKPVDYTKHLLRMMSRNPFLTVPELADRISQSEAFISQRLSLLKLDASIQQLVNEGEIKLVNAYQLAKLPPEEQHNFTDAALTQKPAEFVPAVQARAKELRDFKRAGKESGDIVWEPIAHCRKMGELKAEFANGEVGPAICAAEGCESAAEGFAAGIAWVISLDTASVEAQRSKNEQRTSEREAAKIRRTAEREAKKATAAAEKAEEAKAAAEAM